MDKKAISFDEYNPDTANWENYIERLKFCFEANGIIVDTVKRANFFTVCGSRVYETLLALITPRKAIDVTFTEIETILGKHYSPKPNEISMSFKFYKRDQKRGKPASSYIAELRKLSSGCNFSDLKRMLRDRLVCGMCDSRLQYELLKRENLQYQHVVDAMLSSESAGRDVRVIQAASTSFTSELPTHATTPEGDAPEPMEVIAVQTTPNLRMCFRCGNRHPGECWFINAVCRYCKKRGHIEKICIKKKKSTNRSVSYTEECDDYLNGIYNVQSTSRIPPIEVEVFFFDMPVRMQVDTGASFTLINEYTWNMLRQRLPCNKLQQVQLSLRTWNETPVHILGQVTVPVQYKDIEQSLDVIVAKGSGPNLLGRDWLAPLNIIMNINFISNEDFLQMERLISKYEEVFKDGLGTYRGQPVTIHTKPGTNPKFLKARPVPYAIKARVEKEIDRLEREGVLKPISFSEWATPVVPILKKSGEVRLCGDYRSTVNEATESDTYPMPTASEVFAIIAGGKFFTTLDLDRAYTQVLVDDETAKLLTLNTSKGLYTVHRLAFGVKACPGIFQRLMTSLLAGIQGVAVLIDDIIVCGRTMLEMQGRLDLVLSRMEKAGLRLNKNKCKFAKERVEFLGFVIDSEGIHPAPSKVESILNTPEPKNKKELQAFLGLYNFYERFIPHKATILEPLHRLLDSERAWKWSDLEQKSFLTAKRLLTLDLTLVHYDENKPLILTCDSSEYGVGAVLSNEMEDGQKRPIAMASRTLHSYERRYSQLDKEATSIMFEHPEQQLSDILLLAEAPEDFPYDVQHIASETKRDKTLSRVMNYIHRGWPDKHHITQLLMGWQSVWCKTITDKLRKMDDLEWEIRIPNLLLTLRCTPCTTTNKSPSELLMKRRLRTLLDTLHPDNIQRKKTEEQITKNNENRNRETNVEEQVMFRNYNPSGPRWLPGKIIEKRGPSTYRVKTNDDAVITRHIDQLIKKRSITTHPEKEGSVVNSTQNTDNSVHEENKEGVKSSQEFDRIIEIPDASQWEEILGIPSTFSDSIGKTRNELNLHSKLPYQRP
ncbi:uncharacterized protein LOC124539615 [Vanessa cardui]|uniref:uncharacterized protein LOC124539615 n=1 Tax=Vanessa cardui TaxID=171605 RepID=UPI001F13B864|nr:uncharacterized protein LOC124539615 [Vanessa cardui]